MSNNAFPPIVTKRISLGVVDFEVAVNAGPRILACSRTGSPGLFVSLPRTVLEHPAVGRYRLLGGHRLWQAPENPAVTYRPDDQQAIEIAEERNGFALIGEPDADGLTKTIRVTQHGESTVVDHVLSNRGDQAITCAPWAITQLVTGGRAYLPQTQVAADADGVLPNRHLVLWPYTTLADVEFDPGFVVVPGSDQAPASKLGQPNRRGWIAYVKGDQAFVKWAPLHDDAAAYADLDATVQCYRNESFVELESLGPLVTLGPGADTNHTEVWRLIDLDGRPPIEVLASLPASPGLTKP